ncbi:thiol reductant ABC exporter subunit CydC [uncultured Rhodoblastus sp.]|uniref:thiol reductant ABC exporter subunit CydC n=1 Tax=uncultured Rhodoblastus sp. TaxID=543037 RepID=UPI0025E07922|nr:thiol reductant ABC exporter subunit CydC [uncultured Rhodoblastus sp.]
MKAFARLLGLYRPYALWIAASILVSLTSVLANIGLMATSGWFITAMAAAGLAGGTMNYFTPAALIRALAILRAGGRYLDRLVSHEATFRLIGGSRSFVFARLEPIAPAELGDLRSGDLAERLRGDIDRLELVFLRLLSPFVVALLAAGVIVAVLARWSAALAGAAAMVFLVAGFLAPALAAFAGRVPSRATALFSAEIRARMVDDLEGLAPLLLTGADARHFGALEQRMEAMLAAEGRLARIGALGQISVIVASELAVVALLGVGVPLVRSGALAGAELTLAALAALASFEAFGGLPAAFAGLAGSLASAERLFGLFDRKTVVVDPDKPALLPRRFDLVLEKVCLSYPGAYRAALENIDIEIGEGARVALIGPSGAGKSSIADLLVRFRDPTGGEIRLGGEALPRLAIDDIRSRIMVVGQSPHLFSATVAENLRIARPHATADELWAALASVRLDETIGALPEGLDTQIGVAGTRLSGGQARRLAVARGLLTEASIFVLDEPTEGLDAETARQVLDGVFQRTAGRTLLLLTHRHAGLERMDQTIGMDGGKIMSRSREPTCGPEPANACLPKAEKSATLMAKSVGEP